MLMQSLPGFRISEEVSQALTDGLPVVALESTVITHGLPYPQNITLAFQMEGEIRRRGVVPATIAVLEGEVWVGARQDQLERLVHIQELHKISSRDLGAAIAARWSGGTTVAGTLAAAHLAGIQVFATGGIGGVHRQSVNDVSADIPQLAQSPLVVVCSGAKAILDLPATVEALETFGVPVIGYRTDELPAFYSRSSGLPVSARADSPALIAAIARSHWEMGLKSAVLVGNPPPDEVALPAESVNGAVEQALSDAIREYITGQQVTPFLLRRVTELTGGDSLKANLGLLLNNAGLAAEIAIELANH